MKVVETQMTLVALTLEEIETIMSGLEIEYHECRNQKSGTLFHQFMKIKEELDGTKS